MTLQEQILSLLNTVNAVNEENQILRRHIDALVLMQSKALAPQLGLEIKFSKEEIEHIESVASIRLFGSNAEEFFHKDYETAERGSPTLPLGEAGSLSRVNEKLEDEEESIT